MNMIYILAVMAIILIGVVIWVVKDRRQRDYDSKAVRIIGIDRVGKNVTDERIVPDKDGIYRTKVRGEEKVIPLNARLSVRDTYFVCLDRGTMFDPFRPDPELVVDGTQNHIFEMDTSIQDINRYEEGMLAMLKPYLPALVVVVIVFELFLLYGMYSQ